MRYGALVGHFLGDISSTMETHREVLRAHATRSHIQALSPDNDRHCKPIYVKRRASRADSYSMIESDFMLECRSLFLTLHGVAGDTLWPDWRSFI
jgi:hypothetical protein